MVTSMQPSHHTLPLENHAGKPRLRRIRIVAISVLLVVVPACGVDNVEYRVVCGGFGPAGQVSLGVTVCASREASRERVREKAQKECEDKYSDNGYACGCANSEVRETNDPC